MYEEALLKIKNSIDEIAKKADKTKIFHQKCQIVTSSLEDNLKQLEVFLKSNDSEIHQELLLKLNEELTNLSQKIDTIGNDAALWTYLFDREISISTFLNDIDKIMKIIYNILKKIGIKSPRQFNSNYNYDDYSNIDDFLIKAQQILLEKRKEVDKYLKQNSNNIFDNKRDIDEENNNELSKYRNFKTEKSKFDQSSDIIYENDVFSYYNGTRLSDQKKVTILKLKPEYKHIFIRLLSVLVKINHPNVEKFIGAYIEDGEVTIITNRNGKNLSEYLLKDISVCNYGQHNRTILAFKIAQGMSYLHSRNIIHRNLTEENIFIPETNDSNDEVSPMICGFRDSRFLPVNQTSSVTSKNLKKLSKTDSKFFAPEYFTESRYDEKIDVFTFSGLLYHFITGRLPYSDLTLNANVKAMLQKENRPDLPEDLPDNLKELITSCWAHKANERFSFDKVVSTMIQNKIVFPSDKENEQEILKFYERNSVKSDKAKQCIDLFERIKLDIGKVFQYRFEFLSIRSIIYNYQYMLRKSRYSNSDDLTNEDIVQLEVLNDRLRDLSTLVSNCEYEIWYNNATKIEISQVSKRICECTDEVFDAMVGLGFEDIPQYKESVNDMVFDYRELMNFCDTESRKPIKQSSAWELKAKEVQKYMRDKKKWNENLTKKVLNERLKDLFSPLESYLINRSDYHIDDIKSHKQTLNSEVYKGTYTNPKTKENKNVAIKIIRESHFKSENELTYLRREAGFLVKLNHPYIAKFIGFGLSNKDNDVWIISEWVPDGTLFSRWKTNDENLKLSPNDKAMIAFQIAEAMDYMHSKNILHLDLKSTNVLLDGKTPKIIDFGISCPDNDALKILDGSTGTLHYMAPEIRNKKPYGKSADVFSFAILLWEMVIEDIPLNDKEEEQIPEILEKGVDVNSELGGKIKENNPLLRFIRRGTEPSTKKRGDFESIMSEMIRAKVTFPGGDRSKMCDFYRQKAKEVFPGKKIYKDAL